MLADRHRAYRRAASGRSTARFASRDIQLRLKLFLSLPAFFGADGLVLV
jgi:hypothetical protein